MTLIKNVIDELELLAPPNYQESYDNSGLIVGDPTWTINGILVGLDCTEEVVLEAKNKGCNLIVVHHPIVFKGLKKFNGKNYVERTVISAIKNDIAIYAIHTNLDNVYNGVNHKIADKLELLDRRILMPKSETLLKLSFYCPTKSTQVVKDSLFELGAGQIGNYDSCSFSSTGTGTFRPLDGAKPFVGKVGEVHKEPEEKVEVLIPSHLKRSAINRMKEAHPYEEVAYFLSELLNDNQFLGSGMIGDLSEPMNIMEFLEKLKSTMNTGCVRHTSFVKSTVQKIALIGGSGSFALPAAIAQKADVFITADFKYHEFFDADGNIVIADIGHYESEQYTIELLVDYLKKKIPNFAVLFTEINTNPVNYL